MPIEIDDLPRDPDVLLQIVRDLVQQVEKLHRQNEYLTRQMFGRRSEKLDPLSPDQGTLFPGDTVEAGVPEAQESADESGNESESEQGGQKSKSKNRRRRKPGDPRPSLPPHLPRVKRHHHPDGLTTCPHCGKVPKSIAVEKAGDQLEYFPGGFYVVEDFVHTESCGCGETIAKADAPMRPIQGGLPGAGALAQVLTSKYCDHTPLHRQEEILKRQEVEISRSVLCGWVGRCANLLLPIYTALKAHLLSLDYVGFDATRVKVQEKGRGRCHLGTMWAYRSDRDCPVVCFEYTRHQTHDGPKSFLQGVEGYVQADAHPIHDPLFLKNTSWTEVGCWAHARRNFEKILKGSRRAPATHARTALAYIQTLFKIEKEAVEHGLGPDERLAMRQENSRPVMDEFRAWLDDKVSRSLPKHDLGQALRYIDNNWVALSRFLEDGRLELHNNFVEQELRKIALGRNNWIFFGNENGARWGAIIFSIVGSCRRAGVDPWLYFADVLERISTHSRVEDLLPHRWKELFEATAKANLARTREELHATGMPPQPEA